MVKMVQDRILRSIDDESVRFVFPSEVAVRFWRKETLCFSGRRAIPENRFISWDGFKEAVYREERAERPVNALYRTIFASALLAENGSAAEPFFLELIPPRFSRESAAFARDIGALLPVLELFLEGDQRAALSPGMAADFLLLRDRYREFLRKNRLFEPLDRKLTIRPGNGRFVVFFPEVIEDADRYLVPVIGSGRVETIHVPEGASVTLARFSSWDRELKSLFRRIRNLVETGTDPSDIMVTVCGLDSLSPVLSEYGELYGVPVAFRSGRPLSSYSPGRLFRNLQDARSAGFGTESLKSLFLDLGVPWKDGKLFREIIQTGIEEFCVGTYRNGDRMADSWNDLFRRTGKREAGDLFRSFTRETESLVTSPGFPELKANLFRFLSRFMDTGRWSSRDLNVLQYIQTVLWETAEAAERLVGLTHPEPFALFLSLLEGGLYVEKAAPGAVGIYPYRVAAGTEPEHHFIINASQEGTTARVYGIPFVSEELREAAGLPDRDLRPSFLALYGESGKAVYMSYSAGGFSGPETAPGFIVARGTVHDEPDEAPAAETAAGDSAAEGAGALDPYRAEQLLWAAFGTARKGVAAEEPGFLLYQTQKEGFERAERTLFVPPGLTATKNPLPADLAAVCAEKWRGGPQGGPGSGTEPSPAHGVAAPPAPAGKISASGLERYWGCPFFFLLSKILGIEEGTFDLAFSDPLTFGSLQHEALKILLDPKGGVLPDVLAAGGGTAAVSSGGSLAAEACGGQPNPAACRMPNPVSGALLEAAEKAVSRAFGEWERSGKPRFIPPVWKAFRRLTVERVVGLLETDAEEFPAHRVHAVEAFLEWTDPDTGVRFIGFIDRITERNGKYHLVDYKNSGYIKQGSIARAEGVLGSYQIPFYLLLAGKNGLDAEGASYFILNEGKYNRFFDADGGKAWFTPEETAALVNNAEASALLMARRIGEGRFETVISDGCGSCAFRYVCRDRYVIR